MHEMAIADSIAEQVRAAAKAAGNPRVERVRLRIGALRAVVPEALTLCFEAVVRGTPLEGAALDIETIPMTLDCRACGTRAELPDGAPMICERCGAPAELIAGRELVLDSIEVED